MHNILTVDIEEYFQVENFKNKIPYSDWMKYETRVFEPTLAILSMLEKYEAQATFFVLGWVAERYPALVKRIHGAGHEIATHGYRHELVYHQNASEFSEDLRKSIAILQDITGEQVLGYRAPSFSITEQSFWALDIIKEQGLVYDASIFPISGHDKYGVSDANPNTHVLSNGLYEVPAATIRIGKRSIPAAGGGYFRLYPYWLTKHVIRYINKQGRAAVVYVHPWEFDIEQPRIHDIPISTKFRHYVGISRNTAKFERLLSDFQFTSINTFLQGIKP